MKRSARMLLAAGLVLAASGCYHAVIETGLTPSNVQLQDKWADSWVHGLVPPDAIQTMERCPRGVARVETRLSFLNQLVGILTWGIYTPMEITVTCAEGTMEDADLVETPEEAARALEEGRPFLLRVP